MYTLINFCFEYKFVFLKQKVEKFIVNIFFTYIHFYILCYNIMFYYVLTKILFLIVLYVHPTAIQKTIATFFKKKMNKTIQGRALKILREIG